METIKVVFDTNENEKQKLAASYWVDNETEQIMYGGAKYGGKSYLGCSLIFGDALIYPETYYFIARSTLTDLRKYTIPSIGQVFRAWGLEMNDYTTYNGQDNYFLLQNGSRVYFIDASHQPSDPDYHRLGSIQMTRGWCEEAGDISAKAVSNLFLTVGRWKNDVYGLKKKMLLTCNPHKGHGYRNFYKPFQNGTLESTKKFIIALPTDNKSGDQDYILSLKNNTDRSEVERLYFGNWEYENDPLSMMPYAAINDLFTNTIVKSDERYLIVDAARFGADKIGFTFWKGLDCYKIIVKEKQGTDQTEEDIRDFAAKEKIPYSHILVDEDGIGGGIVDHLRGIKGFVANRTPTNDPVTGNPQNFKNLKAQCAYLLAEKVKNHEMRVSVTDEKIRELLVADLEQYKVKNADQDGKKQIISKDEMKEHLGRSPDLGDCMLMRMYFELKREVVYKDYEQKPYQPTSEYEAAGSNTGIIQPSHNTLSGIEYEQEDLARVDF